MLYLIRHAQSRFNKVADALEEKYGSETFGDEEEYLKEKFSHEYLDVEITEEGIEQAKVARDKMAGEDVDVVIVSPMRRALRTCQIIFENHKSKPVIFVEPSFREIMESSNDIGSKMAESMQLFPHFNYDSIKDKEAWFIYTLLEDNDRNSILEQLKGIEGEERGKKAVELLMPMMRENWATRRKDLKNEESLKHRVMSDYEEQLRVLTGYFQKYDKIAVVAHSECIKRYVGYKIKNCEIYPLSRDKLPHP
jgi:bisphosphoglycerate-dependent phosphoglycerate mutase